MDIGIVSEGVTDQIIIEAIVQGYFENKDIVLEALQPKKDAPGGWPLVIDYCKSEEFKQSFPYRDGFTIIHIDCDILKGNGLPEDCIMHLHGLDNKQTFETVRNKLLEFIGLQEGDEIANKIVFAIAIDSIECWILPLYIKNKPKVLSKISGCVGELNKVLPKAEGFYIDKKEQKYYRVFAKHFTKNKNVKFCYENSESLSFFIDSLENGFQTFVANQ